MKYRKFGKLDWEASVLGFGAMRLPFSGQDANIDEEQTIRMIRYALDHGVNYIDSAWLYHSQKSEIMAGKALRDGYRAKTRIATKIPSAQIDSLETCDRFLNTQLERWQTDKIDFYLLHGLRTNVWHKVRDLNIFKWAEKAMADGRIGYLGFSFHDELSTFKEIIDGYDNWTMCQIQYNFMDENFQAGTEGLKYAASKGLAVVVMEPIRGGRLSRPPEPVAKLWETAPVKRSPAEWALRWVWNHPEVTLALSGMSEMNQVIENVGIADRGVANSLTNEDMELIGKVRDVYRSLTPISCTSCRYCMPCKNGVDIPRNFELYNDAIVFNFPQGSRFMYRGERVFKKEHRAEHCQECKECVERCPQNLEIPELLKKVHEYLKE